MENLIAALWLYFAHYNFVQIHETLRMTPAMAANVTDHLWTIEELLNAGADGGFQLIGKTRSLDLEFRSPYPLKKGDLPGHASAHVMVKTFSRRKDGSAIITPECVSRREIKHEIDRLKEELEEIRKVAKKKFALHKEREEGWRTKHRNRSS